jgi:hypothetical protein
MIASNSATLATLATHVDNRQNSGDQIRAVINICGICGICGNPPRRHVNTPLRGLGGIKSINNDLVVL